MKSLKYEFRSLMTVGVLAGVIGLSFPMPVMSFSAHRERKSDEASLVFVHLTQEEESSVLLSAKSAWQSERGIMERMRIRLPLGELPEEQSGFVFESDSQGYVLRENPIDPVAYPLPAFVPSSAAERIPALESEVPSKPMPTFSHEELLNIN